MTGLGLSFSGDSMATILVDQSYKIEQTNHDTVVAATRGAESVAIRIDRRLKRKLLQEFGKSVGGRRIYLWLFAWGASKAIAEIWHPGDKVLVDLEYKGSSELVEDLIAAYLKRWRISVNRVSISSSRIGRHALVDRIARMPRLAKQLRRIDISRLRQVAAALGLE